MQRENEVQHVFLVGAKSLGAYGGYETFVYKLTEYHQNKKNIKYHVACKANGDGCMDETKVDGVTRINDHEFEFHNAHCFKIDIPQIGPAQAIYYDVAALKACCKYIKEHRIKHPIVYIMACRIGPFAGHFYKEIHKLGGTVYLNPDGHEWMRAKWSAPIRRYWKISEQMMVKYCDLAICDSVNIEKYIHECYDGKGIKGSSPKTTFIAYGADLTLSKLADDDEKLVSWYKEKGLTKKGYYLVVGRFVPENSFEVMIREFMKSKSEKDFALITNVNDKFLNELEETSKKIAFKKHPISTVVNVMRFLNEKVYRIGICPKKYRKMIALEAPDGTGKTTFIDALTVMLAETFVCDIEKMHVYHFRPSVLPNLGAVGEKAGVMKQDTNFENPHRNKAANPLSSFVRMGYYWLDYLIGGAICIRKDVQFDKITIFDRYIYDFIIDPLRSRINLPRCMRTAFSKMVQQPRIVFVLDAPADVIYSRKKELTLDEIQRQLEEFDKLSNLGDNFYKINANQTPEKMVLDAKKIILDKFCLKIQK